MTVCAHQSVQELDGLIPRDPAGINDFLELGSEGSMVGCRWKGWEAHNGWAPLVSQGFLLLTELLQESLRAPGLLNY